MTKVSNLLNQRLNKKSSKTAELAELSRSGHLSSFAGVFHVATLTESEQDGLRVLLSSYGAKKEALQTDYQDLSSITSEIKAINNQAAILHGERIKRAQQILKKYSDGAFSAWLMQTYGNRQTPYNFLQYYELYKELAPPLKEKADVMPRQAIYTLATRKGNIKEKEAIIKEYKGESKKQLLTLIRRLFPLADGDRRKKNSAEHLLRRLNELKAHLKQNYTRPTLKQKKELKEVLQSLHQLLGL